MVFRIGAKIGSEVSDTEASLDFRFQRLLGARVAPQQSPVFQTTFFNVSLTRQGCNFAATSSQSLRATILSGLFKLTIASIYDLSGSTGKLVGRRHVVDRTVKPNASWRLSGSMILSNSPIQKFPALNEAAVTTTCPVSIFRRYPPVLG